MSDLERDRRPVFNGKPLRRSLWSRQRRRNEFRDNDFAELELLDVSFRTGIDLDLQRLPSGQRYTLLPDAAGARRCQSAGKCRYHSTFRHFRRDPRPGEICR